MAQNWEYAEVEVTIGGPLSGTNVEGRIFKIKGGHQEFHGRFGEVLADLGLHGWELAAASARTDTGLGGKHKINYIFKRPIQSE